MHDLSSREIIAEWSRNRDLPPLSAEEMLAMAYNEMARRTQQAYAEVRRLEAEMASLIYARAMEMTGGHDFELRQIDDPTVWILQLEPVRAYTRMLSAHPSRWTSTAIDGVTKQVSQVFAEKIMERLYEMREEVKRPLPAQPEQEPS